MEAKVPRLNDNLSTFLRTPMYNSISTFWHGTMRALVRMGEAVLIERNAFAVDNELLAFFCE